MEAKPMKDRIQMFDAQRNQWVKYDTRTGASMQVKRNGKPFRRIRKA